MPTSRSRCPSRFHRSSRPQATELPGRSPRICLQEDDSMPPLDHVVRSWPSTRSVLPVLLVVSVLAGLRTLAQGENGAGVVVSDQTTAKDVGLPIYPGARPHRDTNKDSEAVRLGLWGGGAGLKLAVLKMESNDAPSQVAEFYQRALAKYGRVLDCTRSATSSDRKSDSRTLTCEQDQPDPGGMLFKSGTKDKQHLVAIEPHGGGTTFALIYVWTKGE
jgi:hypothetical protein